MKMEALNILELREKIAKASDTIIELKKQNNNHQDTIKKLKARLRWPPHVQAAVLSKEASSDEAKLRQQVLELSGQCRAYQQRVQLLEQAEHPPFKHAKPAPPQAAHDENLNSRSANNSPSVYKTAMHETVQEWKVQEKMYNEQLEEAGARVLQSEERLAQLLRLRTMDSAELIRLSRAAKIKAAEVTTLQDQLHRLKQTAEEASTKFQDVLEQLNEERHRKSELQEEIAQSQLSRQAIHDLTQELEEAKKERDLLRSHLKSSLLDTAVEAAAAPVLSCTLTEEISALQAQVAELRQALTDKSAAHQTLSSQLQEMREHSSGLAEENLRLRRALESQPILKPTSPRYRKDVRDQAIQTLKEVENFKPPDVSCALSGEESDQLLAQMHAEVENHRQLVRTQTHLTKLFKDELESVHEQLRREREQYAAELAAKMVELQRLQSLVPTQQEVAPPAVIQPYDSPKKVEPIVAAASTVPTPAPRKKIVQQESVEQAPSADTSKITGLQIEITSISAIEESSVLLSMDSESRLFFEFSLQPSEGSPEETPGTFPRPSAPGQQVPIGYSHTWSAGELEERATCVLFSVVGEPQETADGDQQDCLDLGHVRLELNRQKSGITSDLPIWDEAEHIIGHLRVVAQWLPAPPVPSSPS